MSALKCARCDADAIAYHEHEPLCSLHWLEAKRDQRFAEALWEFLEEDMLSQFLKPSGIPAFLRDTIAPPRGVS